jgi:hypothetical protein
MQIGAHHHPYPHIVADWADGRGPDPSERVSALLAPFSHDPDNALGAARRLLDDELEETSRVPQQRRTSRREAPRAPVEIGPHRSECTPPWMKKAHDVTRRSDLAEPLPI